MIATLRLEAIGDNYARLAKRDLSYVLKQVGRIPPAHFSAVLTGGRRPWVARITGFDRQYGLARDFLTPLRDYRDANGGGSRGVYWTYVLRPEMLYEVRALLSWTQEHRYFCRVDAGTIVHIHSTDVEATLRTRKQAAHDVIPRAARS